MIERSTRRRARTLAGRIAEPRRAVQQVETAAAGGNLQTIVALSVIGIFSLSSRRRTRRLEWVDGSQRAGPRQRGPARHAHRFGVWQPTFVQEAGRASREEN